MAVEARSLSTITHLAFNPPTKPAQSIFPEAAPLTLYIVRVPGSRDVFLTPLKPRDRVVNAQDVQSSLYFLHIDSPEDLLIPGQEARDTRRQELSRTLTRKPVGSVARRPLPTPPASPCDENREPCRITYGDSRSTVPERKPVVPPRSPNRYSTSSLASELEKARSSSFDSLAEGETSQMLTLTLIRRDPSSGEQWNVAKVHDPPVDEVSSATVYEKHVGMQKVKNSGAPLYLSIQNPGYSHCLAPEERTFKRRLWMDGSRYGDHSYSAQQSISLAGGDRRSRGYAFRDAWGQKCEFSTASTGRALKCRRVGPQPQSSEAMHPTRDISELRFNLPVRHVASKSESAVLTGGGSEANHKRLSYFSHHQADAESARMATRSSFCEDGSIDYSLGRERAGGGFGGREAKLGKLIVQGGGQEMLDLVVAANMALWWRAYERTAGGVR
ncbi:hypothetical protein ANO11243_037070 [Dothideomycetidae sp. 11243]|nr:hypothetical protein ANO11243_037070 [fungal sp. No.11243]